MFNKWEELKKRLQKEIDEMGIAVSGLPAELDSWAGAYHNVLDIMEELDLDEYTSGFADAHETFSPSGIEKLITKERNDALTDFSGAIARMGEAGITREVAELLFQRKWRKV